MRVSIKLKLVLGLVLAILTPLTLTTTVNLWISVDRMEKDLQQRSLEALKDVKNALIFNLKTIQGTAEIIAENKELKSNFDSETTQEFLDDRQHLWFNIIVEIFNSDKELMGRVFTEGMNAKQLFTLSSDPVVTAALELEEFSDYASSPNGLVLRNTKPLVDYETLEAKGVLVVTYPINIQFLQSIKEQVKSEVTLHWDSNGNIVSTVRDSDGKEFSRGWDSSASSFISFQETYLQRRETIGAKEYAVSYSQLKNSEGKILGAVSTALDYKTIERSKRDFLNVLSISAILVFGLALLVGLIVARKFTDPIYKLVNAFQMMAKGRLEERVHLKQNDELGDLAVAFNDMGEQLQYNIEKKPVFKKYF